MYYVYILQSIKNNSYYYGFAEDIKTRLKHHNSGSVAYTKNLLPYNLIWFCAFDSKKLALDFEKYIKSSSGHTFSRKRLLPSSIDK